MARVPAGGQAVLFTIVPAGGSDNAQIAVLDLQTGTSKVLVRGGSHAHYVPTGHLVYGQRARCAPSPSISHVWRSSGRLTPVLEGVMTTEMAPRTSRRLPTAPWSTSQGQLVEQDGAPWCRWIDRDVPLRCRAFHGRVPRRPGVA